MSQVQVNWHGSDILNQLPDVKKRAIFAGLSFLKQKSNAIAPLDTNMHIGTSHVEVNGDKGKFAYVQPYSIKIHETPMNFQRGRQHKFLERPLMQHRDDIGQIVLEHLRDPFS